ncbi:membrane protein [Clostridia bacterium]|nr:membrane protein [Clostridia bacterium]
MKLKSKTPLTVSGKAALFSFLGGVTAILLLGLATEYGSLVLLMAPFGASCVLLFSAWDVPLSQPRNLVGGHLLSSIIALAVLQLLGNRPWTMALAVGLALAVMVLPKTTHPPAGADVIVIFVGNAGWRFLLFPVAAGTLLLLTTAIVLNRFLFRRAYPKFWF